MKRKEKEKVLEKEQNKFMEKNVAK